MQDSFSIQTTFSSPEATADFARNLAPCLVPGDTILLEGPIGAGKSHFARALIQARLSAADRLEDVPSPTFTLVQTYDDGLAQIWHADLYRLSNVADVDELGLWDAFDTSICLVEWPDRMGTFGPQDALTLSLAQTGNEGQRIATFTSQNTAWQEKLRHAQIDTFLLAAGWSDATRTPLAGDASARKYERLLRDRDSAVLMDAPPHSGETIAAFVKVASHLRDLGFSAPKILYADQAQGLLLLEDLGDDLLARITQANPDEEPTLYNAAIDVLVELHRYPPPPDLVHKDAKEMAEMTALVFDFYAPSASANGAQQILEQLEAALHAIRPFAPVLALRDFHAENLLWLPDRSGTKRVGLLDFQDAFACHPAYDLISLTRDARRDVSTALAEQLAQRYIRKTGQDENAFLAAAAILAVQRNLRILGIFARLALRDGKPEYLNFIPRVWNYLTVDLAHPALDDLRKSIQSTLPEPTEKFLQELRLKCQTAQAQ